MTRAAKDKLMLFILLLSVFLFFVIFFTTIHPIMISDTDDWLYSYYQRDSIPIWKGWNPSRIFPEVFMPLVSYISAYLVYPLTGDYFGSFTLIYAISVSFVLTILIWAIIRYFTSQNRISLYTAMLLSLFYLVCQFWIFRIHETANTYMLIAVNSCTYFYYVIPNLLNCALVFFYISLRAEGFDVISKKKLAIYIFSVYFCIFSNIWASVIIASYVGAVLVYDLFSSVLSKRFLLKEFLKGHTPDLILLAVWIIAQLYELSGGRADSLGGATFASNLKATLLILFNVVKSIKRIMLISCTLILIAGGILIRRHNHPADFRALILFLLAFLFSGLYLVFSCAKTSPDYLSRPSVFYCAYFFGMTAVLICLGAIFRKVPILLSTAPLLLFIIIINCNTTGKTYLESAIRQYEPEVYEAINEDIMNQFTAAEKAGDTEITLYVPDCRSSEYDDNFPLALYSGYRFSEQFYKFGITTKKIKVTEMIPASEKNRELGVPYSGN